LKRTKGAADERDILSPPARGRGLKHSPMQPLRRAISRPPRGGVD